MPDTRKKHRLKHFLTILFLSAFFSAFSQTGNFDYLTANRRFTIAGRTVKGISNDSIWLIASADSLVTQYAVKGYVDNHFGPGTDNAYNFNPEQFIVSGYDVSIRFPQDPGEPLFTNSPSFNFTQQHLNFLDSLMLAVGEDTYLDDRDFYYSQDTLNPIRWKAFTLTTSGTGAATWDSTSKNLNIPVSVSGPGGGSTGNYHLPYNGDSLDYIGGDTLPHHLPPMPPPGDSIDYSFTALTTVYNEYGPGEYTMTSNGVSANPDNLNFPFRQLKAIDVGGWSAGAYLSFTKNTTFSTTAFTFLRAFIRLKSALDIPTSLSFRFFLNGSPISSTISCVNYGLIKNKVGSYMNISIPLTAFGFTANNYDEIRFELGGSNTDGLYMDLVQLQNATTDENKYVTDVHRIPGTVTVQQVLGGQNVFAFNDSIGIATDTTPLHNQLLQQLAAIQNNTASILLKLNISDTAAMLSPYASKIAANTTAIAGKEPIITAGTTSQYWRGDKTWQTLSTTAVAEGTNLYYTDARARAAISLTTTGTSGAATYDNSTGVLNVPNYASSGGSGWGLSGNSITPANFLGTTSNNSLRFRTNNVERVVFDSVGNLIMGTTISTSTATPTKISMGATYGSNVAGNVNNLKLQIYKDASNSTYGIGQSAAMLEIQANNGAVGIFTTGVEALRASNGNVGISIPSGGPNPNYPLSFGARLSNTTLALYQGGDIYGMGVQANQFRMHLGNVSGRFSFLDAAAGNEIFTIKGNGVIGLKPMTKATRDAITAPNLTQGLMVFVSDNGGYLSIYNAGWQKVTTTADP